MSSLGTALDRVWNNISYLIRTNITQTKIFNIVVLLVVGIGGAKVLSKIIKKGLESTNIDKVSSRSGIRSFLSDMGYEGNLSDFMAAIVEYTFYMLTLMAVISQLGQDFLLYYLREIVSYFPRILLFSLVIFVAFFFAEYLKEVVERFFRKRELSKGVDSGTDIPAYRIFGNIVKYFVYLVAIILGLRLLGFDKTFINMLLLGLVLIFAFLFVLSTRKITMNLLSGIYLQMNGVFKVGDEITISGTRGEVVGFGISYTRLKGEDDDKKLVPNSTVLNEIISLKE